MFMIDLLCICMPREITRALKAASSCVLPSLMVLMVLMVPMVSLHAQVTPSNSPTSQAKSAIPYPQDFWFTHHYFEKVGDEESLPINIVTSLAQDSTGFLWVGTQSGLVRFDGYRFEKFSHSNRLPYSLPDDYVRSIVPGRDGKLWVAGYGGKIAVYDPHFKHFKELPLSPELTDETLVGRFIGMATDSQGGLWVAAEQLGLAYLPPDGGKLRRYTPGPGPGLHLNHQRIRSLYVDKSDHLWIGTFSGLLHLAPGQTQLESVASDPQVKDSLAEHGISSIYEASDGKLWLGLTRDGAAWLDPRTRQLHRIMLDNAQGNVL
ncbi:MAG: hypothetical protein E6Q34_06260, partial [Burkholderiaceae bacterium]